MTCKDCPNRYPACHDHCRIYLDEKERKEQAKEEIRKNALQDTVMKRMYSQKKEKRIKRYGDRMW